MSAQFTNNISARCMSVKDYFALSLSLDIL